MKTMYLYDLLRIREFLLQFKEMLAKENRPLNSYRMDAIDDLVYKIDREDY